MTAVVAALEGVEGGTYADAPTLLQKVGMTLVSAVGGSAPVKRVRTISERTER